MSISIAAVSPLGVFMECSVVGAKKLARKFIQLRATWFTISKRRIRWEDVSKRATKKAPHPAEPLVVDGDDACGASDGALSGDAAFGTLFSIVKASEVHTPGASRSASLRSSITGVSHFEVLAVLRMPLAP